MNLEKNARIPQPPQIPLLGNAYQLDSNAPIGSMVEIAKKYGEIVRLDFAGTDMVLLASHELVNEACDEKRFGKKLHRPLVELRALMYDGLFTAESTEKNWEKAHRILMPVFGPVAVRDMFPDMMDIASQMFTKWERQRDGFVIDFADNMTRLTLDTIALTSFSYRFNSFYQNEMHPFVEAMVSGLLEAGARSRRPDIANQLLVNKKNLYADNIRIMHDLADTILAERKRIGSDPSKRDLLDVMLNTQDPVTGERLDDANIRYQLVTFLIAGHETTSGLLSFAMYGLLKNPEVFAKARREIDSVIGKREPTVHDIPRLVYLEQILKETLRLWPTAPAFSVGSFAEQELLGGRYRISRDDILLILAPCLHRDPSVWEDPERFNPDRMAREKFDQLPPNCWKPFGNGARACIGRAFAMQEATLVLASAIQRFDFEFENPHYELEVKETLTLKPADLFVRVRKRKDFALQRDEGRKADTRPLTLGVAESFERPSDSALPLLVLYGSNSGSAESFARKIAGDGMVQGYRASVAPLDDYAGNLPIEGAVIIVAASYEGKPTDNARKFVEWLEHAPAGSLRHVQFAIFGCGNRDWSRTYQIIPKRIDEGLEKAGGTRIMQRGEADARADFFGDFDDWYSSFWKKLSIHFGQAMADRGIPENSLSVDFVEPARDPILRAQGLLLGTVIDVRELVDMSRPGARSKIHVELRLPEGLSYRAGDYLSVLGCNPDTNVKRVLRRFAVDGDAQIVLRGSAGIQNLLPLGRPIEVREVLANYVELAQPVTRKQIQQMIDVCPCPPEKNALSKLIESEATYKDMVLNKRVSALDLLERYQSCGLSFASYLQMLPLLKPRQYSISSSPLKDPKQCTLTVSVVQGAAYSGQGTFMGVTSNFLSRLKPGDKVPLLPKASQQGFHLPDDPETPIIMACAGTGIAPFRGFLEERACLKEKGVKLGEALLFFGCDHPEVDYLYRKEWDEYEALGLVKVRPAFSTSAEGDIRFVQHRIMAERDELVALLDKGANVFVCGDGRHMAPSVRQAIKDSYREVHRLSFEDATDWFSRLELNMRYVEDVFA